MGRFLIQRSFNESKKIITCKPFITARFMTKQCDNWLQSILDKSWQTTYCLFCHNIKSKNYQKLIQRGFNQSKNIIDFLDGLSSQRDASPGVMIDWLQFVSDKSSQTTHFKLKGRFLIQRGFNQNMISSLASSQRDDDMIIDWLQFVLDKADWQHVANFVKIEDKTI